MSRTTRALRDAMGWSGAMVGVGFDDAMYWVFTDTWPECRIDA